MHLPSHVRRSTAAGVLPVILILAALAAAAVVFFVFTKPRLEASAEVEKKIKPEALQPPATKKVTTVTPEVKKPEPPPAPPPSKMVFGFARPADLGKEMVRSLAAGDFERAGHLAAAAQPDEAAKLAAVLKKMVLELKAKPGSEDQVEILGLVENLTRISVPLMVPGQDDPVRLQLDLERDERMGWKIVALHLPKELSPAMSVTMPAEDGKAVSEPGMTPPPAGGRAPLLSVQEVQDPLSFASDFVRALLKHDFTRAKTYVNEAKVPAQRLAGLCIVFEEGKYEFKPSKPLIITVANPEVAWVIAQVQSPSLNQTTEFGLELQRTGTDKPWQVVGMNLSEILGSFASSASKLGVPYTPIVKNPRGGESLALYFEYDEAQLHPRAQKQLEIVAGLLKSDASRRLKINGHADAKGTENYNIALSTSRAEAVKKQLAELGVAAEQIITTGLGTAQPLSPNQKADGTDDPEGRSRNRRAEIYLDF